MRESDSIRRTTRRRLLGAVAAIPTIGLGAQLRDVGGGTGSFYVRDVRFEERAVDVDGDAAEERQVRVSVVPKRRLLSIRLEHPVRQAVDPELATKLDRRAAERDGWYPLVHLTPVEGMVGERVYLRDEFHQLDGAEANDTWLIKHRGFRSTDRVEREYTGFQYGDRFRVVVAPYGDDPRVVYQRRLS